MSDTTKMNACLLEITTSLKQVKTETNALTKLLIKLGEKLTNVNNNLPTMSHTVTKPFIKWVGGKTQIIDKVLDTFPTTITNYHEMFVGGGSVLLGILSLINQNKITVAGQINAYDLNQSLINVYKHIQNNHLVLHEKMMSYITIYGSCPSNVKKENIDRNTQNESDVKKAKENYYYWIRKQYNANDINSVEHAALFIVLNKLSFRGMYREGPNGFNVPYGHYKTTPTLISKPAITIIHNLIKNVKFVCCDFSESFKKVKSGDFVYLDPPYAPVDKKSFVGYTKTGFSVENHKKLFKLTKELSSKNARCTMSNACVELVNSSFATYNIQKIMCKRSINSKKPGSKAMEVLINDY